MGIAKSQPKVSVCIVTYNQEAFIARCLRSVLTQAVDFPLEVVVGDDCSTDGTGEIVDRMAAEDARVRVLRPARNIGVTQNLLAVHNAARGDLVAHLDGDDIMAPGKLVAQVRLLENQPDIVACGHRMAFVDERGKPNGHSYPARLGARVSRQEVVRRGMPFLASSLMYRRAARALTEADFELFDWYFLADILRAGPAAYIDRPLGSYTVNSGSLTAYMKRQGMRERMVALYTRCLRDDPELKPDIFCYAAVAALSCAKQGDPLTPIHRQLLAQSFTPRAVGALPGAIRWALSNAAALTR